MITLIAAMDRNQNIGLNGDMPWGNTMKADLKRFQRITNGKTIIMGRKTLESLPGLLPNRHHIVLSRGSIGFADLDANKVEVVNDIQEIIDDYAESEEEVFVIGGAQIYEQFLPYAGKIHITKILAYLEGDTKFPTITGKWKIDQGPLIHHAEDKYGSQYVVYERG